MNVIHKTIEYLMSQEERLEYQFERVTGDEEDERELKEIRDLINGLRKLKEVKALIKG
uniref:Uncharacterized protein n=1 Tax=viral metagenome TaxID=1070528 RepID=A0A6M3X7A9_9ZZZZ